VLERTGLDAWRRWLAAGARAAERSTSAAAPDAGSRAIPATFA
jgi:hypothetical protein